MEVFECAVCLQQFNDPRVISCGHTFCKSCLQKLKPNQLLCPLCRRAFESVDSLPSNFIVLKWMDENKTQNIPKRKINCDNCEDKPAVVWCENCSNGTYYCTDCDSTTHNTGKATRSHIRLSLKEKSKKIMFTKCLSHFEENKFFCLDCNCNSLICIVCKEDNHPQHKTVSIFKYGEILKNDLKNSILSFNETIKYFSEVEMKIKQEIRMKENERDQLKEKLNTIETDLNRKNIEEEKIIQQRTKAETSLIVLSKSIEEIGVMELMNKGFIDLMKERIKKIHEELIPFEVKERLEKERLEKERLEKERLEKERWEKAILKEIVGFPYESQGIGGITFTTTAKVQIEITALFVTARGPGNWNITLRRTQGSTRSSILSWPTLLQSTINFLAKTPTEVWRGNLRLNVGESISWAIQNEINDNSCLVLSTNNKQIIQDTAISISTGALLNHNSLEVYEGYTNQGFIGRICYRC